MAAFRAPSAHTSHYAYGYYSNAGLRYPVNTSFVAANPSPVFIQAPSEKGADGFAIDFLLGAVSAAVSKSAAAPIERAKLLIQNQDEMIKSGRKDIKMQENSPDGSLIKPSFRLLLPENMKVASRTELSQ
ncbi:hypothetical protein RJ639_003244 [Escallonia herrerae]|uniref:ADP/ATP translocase n=1 Tax=Escallonia herrerae TaxID=1293975 RepID=A0AA89AYG2_9ASTE|nr:hypothetical protein RJ639_003244 [Escallonia herrerae]